MQRPRHLPTAHTEETPKHPLNLTGPPHDRNAAPENTSKQAQHTTPQGSEATGAQNSRASTQPAALVAHPVVNLPATRQPQRSPGSPDRTCAAAHRPWDDDYDIVPAIQHLLAATAPRPHAHQQATETEEPSPPMHPRPLPPAATADQNAEHQQQEPDRAATPRPPPRKENLSHTGRHPSPPHGRRAVVPTRPPRNPSGPRDPAGVEAGESGRQ